MNQPIRSILENEMGWAWRWGCSKTWEAWSLTRERERELRVVVLIAVLLAIPSKSSESSPKWDS